MSFAVHRLGFLLVHLISLCFQVPARAEGGLQVGLAVRDITPQEPIWLSGYAARNGPSNRIDHPLLAQAVAFSDARKERFVLVALDNCEVNRQFSSTVLSEIQKKFGLSTEAVMIISSHTHSAPCLSGVLEEMFVFEGLEKERVERYSKMLQGVLVEIVGKALDDLKPALLRLGQSSAGFAMNRRVFRHGRVEFGENREGPVDRDVPVLSVSDENDNLRAVLFGYACHGTTLGGEDFYTISGDYMAYARQHLEAAFPGSMAVYLTGCGADSNPSPRGSLAFAKQHGLELAGAVAGVLNRPMTPVRGNFRRAYTRIPLPLAPSPSREKLLEDLKGKSIFIQSRAKKWLDLLDSEKGLPRAVDYPLSVFRVGDDLTFLFLAGEPVVDYSLFLKREFAGDHPWVVGFAMEVPCYIPTERILKEGGYEAESSLIYYGIYGPFLGSTEAMIKDKFRELVADVRKDQ